MTERNAKNTAAFRTLRDLVGLVDRFENGTLPASQWNHAAHLGVAAWYLIHFGETEATDRMITGIRRYNRIQGIRATPTGGYHETLTLFWLAIVRCFLDDQPARRVLTRVNAVIRRYGGRRRLHLDYYTRERITSVTARNCWVPPDLQPLPGTPIQLTDISASKDR